MVFWKRWRKGYCSPLLLLLARAVACGLLVAVVVERVLFPLPALLARAAVVAAAFGPAALLVAVEAKSIRFTVVEDEF